MSYLMFIKQLIVMILYLEKLYYTYYYFFTQIIPAFNITPFCVCKALASLINYYFYEFCIYPYCLTPKITSLSLMIFFLQNFYPYTLSLLFVKGHLKAYHLQLSTGSTQKGPSRHNGKNVDWKLWN